VNNLYARSVSFVKDAERSLRFYTETLGFSLDWKYEEQGRVRTDPESDWATDRRSGGSRPRVYGLEDDQVGRFRGHIREKAIKTEVVQWGRPTLVIRDLDENEL